MERRDYPLEIDGLTLYVTDWGRADARPIVMLHGIRGYAETFAGVAAALQPDWRVIAFDQRGRGRSDWDPGCNYYTDTYVRDLTQVADRLGLDHFDLLGHSMGGINAIVFASSFPQRVGTLVIEDAGPGAFEHSDGAVRIRRELETTPPAFANWEEASAFMRALRPSVTEEARQQRLRSMLRMRQEGGFTWQYDHAGIARTRLHPDPSRQVDLEPHVRALRAPTLVIRGGASDYLQPSMTARMQSLNPQIQVMEIPRAGHYVHDDQPEAFHAAVSAFLRAPRSRHTREAGNPVRPSPTATSS